MDIRCIEIVDNGDEEGAMIYEYDDGRHSAGRYSCLYLAKGGKALKFLSERPVVDGWYRVLEVLHSKIGEWSNRHHKIMLARGVRPLYFLPPMHAAWGNHFGSWDEVAKHLGLPVEVVKEIIRSEYKKTADRLDRLEPLGG